MRGRRGKLLPAGALLLAACAHGSGTSHSEEPPPPPRFAVLPAAWLTSEPVVSLDATAALVTGLEETGGARVDDPERAAGALAGEDGACVEDIECIRRVGRTLGADLVIVPRLAGLGDTVLVRVSLVDVEQGTREATRQEVVQDATGDRVSATLRAVAYDLSLPYAPERPVATPWYRRWWVWTIVGAAVAGGAAATTVTIVRDGPEPYTVVPPPDQVP